MTQPRRPHPLHVLDLAQTRAAAVIATVRLDQLDRPTPCDLWDVRDVLNKLVASTLVFTSFGRREAPDPTLDLVNPIDIIGDDPLGAFQDAASACRAAWRADGALDGTAPSTVGDAPAKAVLHARIFDTTVLGTDIARATGVAHGIDELQAAYVLRIARALVPTVRGVSEERYRPAVEVSDGVELVDELLAVTGRDPAWQPPPRDGEGAMT
ncbi:MAG: TIGR03086 family metal-binding protein [Actinomycetota bacterium]